MDTLKEISSTISSLMGPLGVILLGLVVLMGTAYRSGKATWLNIMKDLRRKQGKPNIILTTENPSKELPWKDTGLLQGGIAVLSSLSLLLLFIGVVVSVSAWFWTGKAFSEEIFWTILAYAMMLPVFSVVFMAVITSTILINSLKLPIHFFIGTFLIELTCIIFSWQIAFHVEPPEIAFGLEMFLFVIASLNTGFHIGMRDAIHESNIEMRYPEVSILTDKGVQVDNLRLYDKTNTDYRFIANNGTNYIIPISKISEIRYSQETESQPLANQPLQKVSKPIKPASKSSPTKRAPDAGDSTPS